MSDSAILFDLLVSGVNVCRVTIAENSGLLGALFLAGLVGGGVHCSVMCGPFVLAMTVARLENLGRSGMSEWHRLWGAALIPYHLGRMTTYAGLGALAAAMAGGAAGIAGFDRLGALLLGLAALFFFGYGLQRLGVAIPWLTTGGGGWWQRSVGRIVQPLFDRPLGFGGYGLGLALGFLPCGLLYGAIAAAASSGKALAGAMAMLAFAIGTVPALLLLGLAGHMAGQRWKTVVARVAPALLMLNAFLLSYMAWRMAT